MLGEMSAGLTFDMSGRQTAQLFGCPLDGRVRPQFGRRRPETQWQVRPVNSDAHAMPHTCYAESY